MGLADGRRASESEPPGERSRPTVCLAGNPNVGKSSLFMALTGAAAETAHCAGVTVQTRASCAAWGGSPVEVIDLPGVYSMESQGEDQRAARSALLTTDPDVVVAVADATNLARSLYLPLQLIDMGFRVVVAVNLADEARRRGHPVDPHLLASELGSPVIATVAPRGEGVRALQSAVLDVVHGPAPLEPARATPFPPRIEQRIVELGGMLEARADSKPTALGPRATAVAILEGDADLAAGCGLAHMVQPEDDAALTIAQARHAEAARLARLTQGPAPRAAESLWRFTTTPLTGVPVLLLVIAAMFATLFIVGEVLSGWLTRLWTAMVSPAVTSFVTGLLGEGAAGRIVLWGVDGGILATLAVGIPYILTFYFVLALVEDTGYMNAAAFLSDRVMHRFGLHGRAVFPLIAAGGCNVPAIIATRTLSDERQRLIAVVLATLVPCSARTAVIIGAVAAVAGWQYALLTYGVVMAVVVLTGLALNRLLPGSNSPLVMEMFPFRRPVVRQVMRKTWRRFREFVWDAAPIVIVGSIVLGTLYETGVVWRLAAPLAPIVEGWLLLPAVAGLTLIFAVLRKELALQLLLVFAAVAAGGRVLDVGRVMDTSQIVTYAIVNTLYIPCLATIAVLGRELGWRRTAIVCAGTVLLALLVGGGMAHALQSLGL
jgi:ferrous iron transport protein B